jgi:hypothetical protein
MMTWAWIRVVARAVSVRVALGHWMGLALRIEGAARAAPQIMPMSTASLHAARVLPVTCLGAAARVARPADDRVVVVTPMLTI